MLVVVAEVKVGRGADMAVNVVVRRRWGVVVGIVVDDDDDDDDVVDVDMLLF